MSNSAQSQQTLSRVSRWALSLALFAALWSCGHSKHPLAPTEILRRGLAGEPSTLDPAATTDTFSQDVLRDLYEGLTSESITGEVIPGVAASWNIDATGTQYTFQLRASARWSNGKAVRAQDFVAAWRRVVDPKQASPVADDLRLIAGAASVIAGILPVTALGVYAPSDNVLVVKLEQPAPYLPQLLAHSAAYPIYSSASASTHNPATWISNGPFVLSSWSPGTSIVLTRNAAYWDQKNVRIQQVNYIVISDENAQFARYRAGELDMTDVVPANAIPSLHRNKSSELVAAPFLATAYYGLNLSTRPFAGNLKLRQAIAMAIDRKRLVNTIGFGQSAAFGFVPPNTWNYDPQSWQWQAWSDDKRVAEAKRLYSQAGYSTSTPLHLRLVFNANPVIRNTAITIAAMWRNTLGVDTELTEEEYRVFLQSRHDKARWDVIRLGWTADYNDASSFLNIFRGHSENNDGGYANPAYDALVNEAAYTPDSDRRRTLLESSEKILLADYPVVPLYFYASNRLVKSYVRGVQVNPLNRVASKTLTIVVH